MKEIKGSRARKIKRSGKEKYFKKKNRAVKEMLKGLIK